ncbi:MAG TPA: sugar ABC transporter permease [Methylomirabilota bacterium]|jgi:multiple sugar transport system permease protein|nr:sugar ABC transporter permease [Methylomirabilota bacterium]
MRRSAALAVVLCLPLILLLGGLVLYPFLVSIHLAMLNKSETRFVGLGNYLFLFKRDTFWMVVRQSMLFTITAVLLKTALGFFLALQINNLPVRRQRLWRGLFLIPWVMPAALSTLGWLWLFEPTLGVFNAVLTRLGGPHIPWLSQPGWARFSVILVNVWIGTPFFMIMFLAGLKSIADELYEAASIDGATTLQRLRFITLPMIRNIMAITALFSTIATFANFDIVRVLTMGGPHDTTHLFGSYAFNLGIESGDIPLGASVSLFMFPILAVLATLILRSVRRNVRAGR